MTITLELPSETADLRRPCCLRRFEVQFNCFLEIGKCLFLGVALAGDVEFEALGDIPPPLAPNGSRKWSHHDLIVSQARERCTAARVPMVPSQIRSLTAPRNSVGLQHASRRDPPGVWEGRSFPDEDLGGVWALLSTRPIIRTLTRPTHDPLWQKGPTVTGPIMDQSVAESSLLATSAFTPFLG